MVELFSCFLMLRTSIARFLTQVPQSELDDGVVVEDMSYESSGFLTVDKEGFAMVSTFRRFEYLLWGGVQIHTHHGNLAYVFNPEAGVSSVPKMKAPRLENSSVRAV